MAATRKKEHAEKKSRQKIGKNSAFFRHFFSIISAKILHFLQLFGTFPALTSHNFQNATGKNKDLNEQIGQIRQMPQLCPHLKFSASYASNTSFTSQSTLIKSMLVELFLSKFLSVQVSALAFLFRFLSCP